MLGFVLFLHFDNGLVIESRAGSGDVELSLGGPELPQSDYETNIKLFPQVVHQFLGHCSASTKCCMLVSFGGRLELGQ